MTHSAATASHDTTFNLQQLLASILGRLRSSASQHGVTLSLHLEPDVPVSLCGGDSTLNQVLSGLLDAMITHTGQGEISLQASEIGREENTVELCFSISAPVQDEAFLNATLERSAELLSSLNGESFFEPVPDKGAIIQLTAMFALQHDSAPPPPSPALSILLVDDVQINLELGSIVMEKQGHRVTTAENGAEALEKFQSGNFDMIFMDVQMPVMDGFQATRAIRESERSRGGHIPIIAMTAYATIGDRALCLEAGMDSYISKPVRPAEIVEIIRQFAVSQTREFDAEPGGSPSPAGAAELAVFDRAELLDRLGGRAELIPRFTIMFQESTATALKQLHEAIAAGNADSLHRQAHTIKGAAANIGATRVRGCAQLLDECAKEGNLAAAPRLLSDLEQEYQLFCVEASKPV